MQFQIAVCPLVLTDIKLILEVESLSLMLLPQTPHTCLLCEVHQKLAASGKRVKSLLIAQQLKLMP